MSKNPALAQLKFAVMLFGAAQQLASPRNPRFKARLREHDIAAQIMGESAGIGCLIELRSGKITSRAGLHAKPNIELMFKDADNHVRLSSRKSYPEPLQLAGITWRIYYDFCNTCRYDKQIAGSFARRDVRAADGQRRWGNRSLKQGCCRSVADSFRSTSELVPVKLWPDARSEQGGTWR